jgi:alkylhydroperoxidase/carboxymuconolactone decarboxylase family protein YurZ
VTPLPGCDHEEEVRGDTSWLGCRTDTFQRFGKQYSTAKAVYPALGTAPQKAGPRDARERALTKLGIALRAWREGAAPSHTSRAIETGCTAANIRHVVPLAATTLGFPSMMAAMTWIDDPLGPR